MVGEGVERLATDGAKSVFGDRIECNAKAKVLFKGIRCKEASAVPEGDSKEAIRCGNQQNGRVGAVGQVGEPRNKVAYISTPPRGVARGPGQEEIADSGRPVPDREVFEGRGILERTLGSCS